MLLAIDGIWYNDFYGMQTHAVFPYDQFLRKIADYLQQADVELNGKSVTKVGRHVGYQAGVHIGIPVSFLRAHLGRPGVYSLCSR